MATASLIPLVPQAQTFSIVLGTTTYILTLRWNDTLYGGGLSTPCWVLDIADQNSVPILSGVPLVTGCDILEMYQYLNFGGQLIVQSSQNPDEVPNFTDLGSTGNLYFVTA